MAVVIRLQGLPAVAGSVDIRHFFSGLKIPDGGVHIIGGKIGEAFVIFATDEDARRAMSRTGGLIKNSHVQLFLSSKTEMQNTLEMNRKGVRKHPAVPPGGDAYGANKGVNKFEKGIAGPGLDIKHHEVHPAKLDRREANMPEEANGIYMFLHGLPYTATAEDVRMFFRGLDVVEVLFQMRKTGGRNGNALVKFGSPRDAAAGMARNNEYMGNRFIALKMSTEKEWVLSGGQLEEVHSRQPRNLRPRSRSPQDPQFYIHFKNLPLNVQKIDLKHFLGFPDLPDAQIKFLLDKHQNNTGEGFIVVKSSWQSERCLALHKSILNGRPISVAPIARKVMLDLIESFESRSPPKPDRLPGNYPSRNHSPMKRCMYLRNFPFDVTKGEVLRFFAGFPLREDDVFLLFDSTGVGLGEALVRFSTEEQALLAEGLNRQRFLDTEVLLRCITDEQMKEFGVFIDKPVENVLNRSPLYRDEYNVREPIERPYDLHNDLAYDRRDFRGSPERFRGSNPMDFIPRDAFGEFEREIQDIDYNRPLPLLGTNFKGRSVGGTVHMKNLPFKATMQEILDFFYGYNVRQDAVRVKFTKNGMATGLATVYFENYDEAMAAVNELHERSIGTRKISLSLTGK